MKMPQRERVAQGHEGDRNNRRAMNAPPLREHFPRSCVELVVGPTYPLRFPPFLFQLFPKPSVFIVPVQFALSIVVGPRLLVETPTVVLAVAVHPRQNGDDEQRSSTALRKESTGGEGGAVWAKGSKEFGWDVCQSSVVILVDRVQGVDTHRALSVQHFEKCPLYARPTSKQAPLGHPSQQEKRRTGAPSARPTS